MSNSLAVMGVDQCDQMRYIIFQYLAIYNIEKLPKSYIFCQTRFKILPNTKKPINYLTKIYICCQSGEISPILVTLELTHVLKVVRSNLSTVFWMDICSHYFL